MQSRFRLVYRVHVIQRMFERRVTAQDIEHVLATGEVIEEYPEDQPYPSRLVLGTVGNRPLHVVVADNVPSSETIIITAYEPDPRQWEAGFRRRRRP